MLCEKDTSKQSCLAASEQKRKGVEVNSERELGRGCAKAFRLATHKGSTQKCTRKLLTMFFQDLFPFLDEWKDGCMHAWMDRCVNGWMIDELINKCMDGWKSGMDGIIER